MIDRLEYIDRQIVLFINGCHSPIFDQFMWLVSGRLVWIPLYVTFIILAYRKQGFIFTLIFLVSALLLVFLTDFLSVHAFKDVFLRYRPSHNLIIKESLHLFKLENGTYYEGGKYGFISSHAANFSAIITFFLLAMPQIKIKWLYFLPVFLVGLSRIYLGVHYLSDVLVGYIFGVGMAICTHKLIFIPINCKIQKR